MSELDDLSEYEYLPCRHVCTEDEVLKLADMRVARTILVKDPLGKCIGLLKNSIDAYNIQLVVEHLIRVLESKGYEGDIVILDVRRLPLRPRNPWKKLKDALLDFINITRSTVILYTDDVRSRPRWINIDRVNILCVGDVT
ncbi:MAG: hypothetical protein QXJ97_05970 [Desulfurococcaceae archaeon]